MWCQISQTGLIKGVESMLFRQWASSCLLARFAHLMVISRFIIGAILRYTANCSFIILCIILSYFRCLVHGLVHELRDKPGWAEPLNRPNGHRKEPKCTWLRWLCSAMNAPINQKLKNCTYLLLCIIKKRTPSNRNFPLGCWLRKYPKYTHFKYFMPDDTMTSYGTTYTTRARLMRLSSLLKLSNRLLELLVATKLLEFVFGNIFPVLGKSHGR